MRNITGIVDEPIEPGHQDNLEITVHAKSLADFISASNTPITIGVQGEWGSGKTSLINIVHHIFDGRKNVKQIWINSWEFSLLSSPEEALIRIINKIIDDLVSADPDKAKVAKIRDSAEKIFKGALRVGAHVALGNEAANLARELVETSSQNITDLRRDLNEVVSGMVDRQTNPYEKVIIYVDDLDRIEPRNAVALLELLKNIFNVPRCVFILAIDYQVVVKGLEHKFGKQSPENEWEFRAFFDKIIQLPFMMPMSQYNIGKYVNSLLLGTGFIAGDGLDEHIIKELIMRSIGGNPRSIKRLINSLSLISIFKQNKIQSGTRETEEDEDLDLGEEDSKVLLFALVCLQIAYPAIYGFLTGKPNFTLWDEKFVISHANYREDQTAPETHYANPEAKIAFESEFEIAKQTNDFNEVWQQTLFRICYVRPRLRRRVGDICKLLNIIKNEIVGEDRKDNLGIILAHVMTQTSVTNVASTDADQRQSNVSEDTRNIPNNKILNAVEIMENCNPGFEFTGVFRDYAEYRENNWPRGVKTQIVTRLRQGVYIVQFEATGRDARKVCDNLSILLDIVRKEFPQNNWKIVQWYSKRDNALQTELPLTEPDEAVQLFIKFHRKVSEHIKKIIQDGS